MQAYIVLGVLLGLPLLLGILFRVGAPNLFLSLLSADLLVHYFEDDAQRLLKPVVNNSTVLEYVGLVILVLPMLLTALFMRHTLSKGKVLFHIVPLAITGAIFAAFASKLLPQSLNSQLVLTTPGRWLTESSDAVIGALVIAQLVFLWVFGRPPKDGKKKK